MKVSHEPPDIENLMKLNPRIKPFTNAVPSAVTKKVTFVLHEKQTFKAFVIHEKQTFKYFIHNSSVGFEQLNLYLPSRETCQMRHR